MLRELFKLRRILTIGSSIVAYLPIVAGIIEPMIWPLLLASPLLYHLLYWWWEPLAQYFFPAWWFITGYITGTHGVNQFAPFVIGGGMAILLMGLAQIVHAKTRNTGLVTTGLYKYVRHPQHLGIAVMSFGFLMLNGAGIRVGDIIAWTLVVFIYTLLAESEEAALENEFGESYLDYKRKVPYTIPFLPSTYMRFSKLLPNHGWKRKLALIGVYILVLATISWLLTHVPTFHTR
jgi:protein-S-isoprenylcysteine O-methyltransferase Ste14